MLPGAGENEDLVGTGGQAGHSHGSHSGAVVASKAVQTFPDEGPDLDLAVLEATDQEVT